MKTSLLPRILSDNDADAALLDVWFAEREADKALQAIGDETVPFSVDAKRLGEAAAPHDKDVRVGQIRILSPKLVAGDDVIPYVAVLDRWMENMWLVAPFSPYSYPASTGEMTTGDLLVGRRVLQCWNTRTAHGEIIGMSYVAGMLDESVRQDALALFHRVANGTALPDSFKALVGPPVLSKADPRREYLTRSIARLPGWGLAAIWNRIKDFVHVPVYGRPAMALAAADKQTQTTETFSAPSFDVELDVKHTPAEDKVRMVVYRNGERDATALDGFVIADKSGLPIGEIRNGVFSSAADAIKDGFLLIAPDTLKPVALKPSKKEGE